MPSSAPSAPGVASTVTARCARGPGSRRGRGAAARGGRGPRRARRRSRGSPQPAARPSGAGDLRVAAGRPGRASRRPPRTGSAARQASSRGASRAVSGRHSPLCSCRTACVRSPPAPRSSTRREPTRSPAIDFTGQRQSSSTWPSGTRAEATRLIGVDLPELIRSRRTHKAYAPGAGRPGDAGRAVRARALGAEPQPDQPVAVPRARAGGARAAQGGGRPGGGREARPRADARRRLGRRRTATRSTTEEDRDAAACACYIVLLAAHDRGLGGYWRTPGVLRTRGGPRRVRDPGRRGGARPAAPRRGQRGEARARAGAARHVVTHLA